MKSCKIEMYRTWVALTATACLTTSSWAASLGPSGYFTDFSTQPAAADWSTVTVAGAAGDVTSAAGLDAAVQLLNPSSITTQPVADPGTPPPAGNQARWSSAGLYLQTRPTGVKMNVLMLTLVNNTVTNADTVNISYDFASSDAVTEEVPGHRGYYSLTGAANSWTNLPAFNSPPDGHVSTSLSLNWNSGAKLYILWADDNGSGSPDTSLTIDNVSVGIYGTLAPLSISLTAPTNGASLQGCAITASASVSRTPTNVTYYLDNTPVFVRTTAPFSPVTLPSLVGSHTLYARAQDAIGLTGFSATNTFTALADQLADVAITNSFAGGLTNGPSIAYLVGTCITNQLRVRDPDGTVTSVDWYVNDALRLQITPPNNWNTILLNDALAGTNLLRAVAWDNCGLPSTSAPVRIVVTNPPPPVSILVPNGSIWKYNTNGPLSLDANDLNWFDNGYDDRAWASGPGELGTGDANHGTDANNPESTPVHFLGTTYFRHAFTVANPAQYANLTLRVLRDDGVVVFLNGAPIWTNNIAVTADGISFTNLATVAADDGTVFVVAPALANLLVTGPNVLAVELHQTALNNDSSFDLMLWGQTGGTRPQLTISYHPDTSQATITWSGSGTLRRARSLSSPIPWEDVPGNPASPYTFSVSPTDRIVVYSLR